MAVLNFRDTNSNQGTDNLSIGRLLVGFVHSERACLLIETDVANSNWRMPIPTDSKNIFIVSIKI